MLRLVLNFGTKPNQTEIYWQKPNPNRTEPEPEPKPNPTQNQTLKYLQVSNVFKITENYVMTVIEDKILRKKLQNYCEMVFWFCQNKAEPKLKKCFKNQMIS
jgi:hypothetical protein